jgi:hypothetical protein
VIIVQGNGIVKTISVNKKLGIETKMPQILICYDLMEGLTNEEEDLIFETKPKLFSISTITIANEIIFLLSVEVSKTIINGKSKPQTRDIISRRSKSSGFNNKNNRI